MNGGIYIVNHSAVVATAISIIQIKAGATTPLIILRAAVTQRSSTTSAQTAIQFVRKSAAGTVTSFTPLKLRPSDAAADAVGGTAATGITASAEGTDTDILVREGFNLLNGWLYVPVPEERILVPPAGIIALKFPAAPASATYDAYIIFQELN